MTKKQCRYGATCATPKCTLKHPPKAIFDEFASARPPLNENDQNDLVTQEDESMRAFLHNQYIDSITNAIVYTRWSADEPYVIETYPELGTFPSWDAAYNALFNHVYPSADNREF